MDHYHQTNPPTELKSTVMGRGGSRKGAGRPKGRNATTRSITLNDELWAKLDAMRGELSASAFLAKKIKGMR